MANGLNKVEPALVVAAEYNEEEEEEEETPKSLWLEFCDYTSTAGPNHIKRAAERVGKIIWTIITLGFAAVLIWQISLLFIKFFNFPYNVKLDVKYDSDIQFPAVTICNLNPYR